MKRMILGLFFVMAVTNFSAAKTAGEMYLDCDNKDAGRVNLCAAYLLGVASVMAIIGRAYDSKSPDDRYGPQVIMGLCGGNPSGNDLRHVFLAWIDRYPDQRDRDAADEAVKAFAERWRCK